MTEYQKLVLKALATILRVLSVIAFSKNEYSSEKTENVAKEIENFIRS